MAMISVCIPTYNRTQLLYESFADLIDDDRVSEIVILDDHSETKVWDEIRLTIPDDNDKIKLFRNHHNLGCYHNKREVIHLATNEWIYILDSDNILKRESIDIIWNLQPMWDPKVLLQPEFAKPYFDFRKYADELIWAQNAHKFASDQTLTTMLNAMNYFVNREEYLRVFEDRPEPWTADSLLQNYNWLSKGNGIYVTPGLQYEHRVHDGSHYKEHHRKTGNLYNELVEKLKALR